MILGALHSSWFEAFPSPEIPALLGYVARSWIKLRTSNPASNSFDRDEPALTRSLCEALDDFNEKKFNGITGAFEAEPLELSRLPNGQVPMGGKTDIKFILAVPGTPKLIIECKKLNGETTNRREYCKNGIQRFVTGKYAKSCRNGIMCGFTANPIITERDALVSYISDSKRSRNLQCISFNGHVVEIPSVCAPNVAEFDTKHNRPNVVGVGPILLAHLLLECPRAA